MIKEGDRIKIIGYDCGHRCQQKYSCMGIIIGREMNIKTMQPLNGPVLIEIDGCEYSIGRGLFDKLIYEEVKKDENKL